MIGSSDDVRLDETPPAIDPVSCLPALLLNTRLRLTVRLTYQIQCFHCHEVVLKSMHCFCLCKNIMRNSLIIYG